MEPTPRGSYQQAELLTTADEFGNTIAFLVFCVKPRDSVRVAAKREDHGNTDYTCKNDFVSCQAGSLPCIRDLHRCVLMVARLHLTPALCV